MELKIPEPMKKEHDHLHEDLARATGLPGKIGEAAREVARVLHPHFVQEEEYALPPLGLLMPLAQGKITPDMAAAIPMAERLKAELPKMLSEHKEIIKALRNLVDVAMREGKTEYADFAEKLILHAQTEEEVSYPTTILIGEYLKSKLKK